MKPRIQKFLLQYKHLRCNPVAERLDPPVSSLQFISIRKRTLTYPHVRELMSDGEYLRRLVATVSRRLPARARVQKAYHVALSVSDSCISPPTNAGWVLLLSRDTRARIHTLLRRYAVEIDSSVNRGLQLVLGPEEPTVWRKRINRGTTENRASGWTEIRRA